MNGGLCYPGTKAQKPAMGASLKKSPKNAFFHEVISCCVQMPSGVVPGGYFFCKKNGAENRAKIAYKKSPHLVRTPYFFWVSLATSVARVVAIPNCPGEGLHFVKPGNPDGQLPFFLPCAALAVRQRSVGICITRPLPVGESAARKAFAQVSLPGGSSWRHCRE